MTKAPGDPLIVLLHQSPLSSRTYAPILPLLAGTGRPVALDTPGYGASDATPVEWEIADYARAVWEAVGALGQETPVFFVGQHTGATIAVEAALQCPEQTRGLILHGLALYNEEERAERLATYAPVFEPENDGRHLALIWQRVRRLYPHLSPDAATTMVADYLAAKPDYAAAYRAVFRYDIWTAAERTKLSRVPVLAISGSRDLVHWMRPRISRLLPDTEEATLPDLTDFAAEEDPQAFTTPIASFIHRRRR